MRINLLVNAEHYVGERERTQDMGMRSIATYVLSPSYIHVQYYYTIDAMNIQYQKNTLLSRHNWI